MKKRISLILVMTCLCMTFSGCASKNDTTSQSIAVSDSVGANNNETDGGKLEVDKKLLTVDVTIPNFDFLERTQLCLLKKRLTKNVKKKDIYRRMQMRMVA